VKTLSPNVEDEKERTTFRREVEALATLRHPAILSLVGCTPFDDKTGAKIVILLMNVSLEDYTKSNPRRKIDELNQAPKHIVLLGTASAMMLMSTPSDTATSSQQTFSYTSHWNPLCQISVCRSLLITGRHSRSRCTKALRRSWRRRL
jgi:serine/threonine protein kinase